MKIYIVEKEDNTDDGFWQNSGIIPCANLEVAIRERNKMIEESNEGKFNYSKDGLIATSNNGWVRFLISIMDIIE